VVVVDVDGAEAPPNDWSGRPDCDARQVGRSTWKYFHAVRRNGKVRRDAANYTQSSHTARNEQAPYIS